MSNFPNNPQRLDPYKNFKFRVKWDGRYVAGVSKVSALKRSTDVVEHREGGDPSTSRKSPGRTQFEPITLERGVTEDTEFEQWANKVWTLGAGLGSEVSLADFRKNIVLEFYNEAGQVVLAYKIYRCWPSIYQALPDLDANGAAVAIETLVLENEGWERDASVVPPPEPSFNAPDSAGGPRSAGSTMSHKLYGKYRGAVLNNIDPLGQGRIIAEVPDALGLAPAHGPRPARRSPACRAASISSRRSAPGSGSNSSAAIPIFRSGPAAAGCPSPTCRCWRRADRRRARRSCCRRRAARRWRCPTRRDFRAASF